MTEYEATRVINGSRYTANSYRSMHDAIYACYATAYNKGNWEPRKLRQGWWQFWRPAKHNPIELQIIRYHDL